MNSIVSFWNNMDKNANFFFIYFSLVLFDFVVVVLDDNDGGRS